MKQKSPIELIDFNNCKLSNRNGFYGGNAGAKEGIIYNGENWITKYPKNISRLRNVDMSYSTSPLSEYIGSHIYKILNYDVHETLLGERNGKIVVACKDFCDDETMLREVRTLKNTYNAILEEKLDTELRSTGSTHMVDLKELLLHLEYNSILSKIAGIKERFWECIVIDAFINNNNRNNGDWGLLFKKGEYSIAPIFDNGAAFSNKLSDAKLIEIYENPEMMKQSTINTDTGYQLNGERLTLAKLMKLENDDFNKAILKVVPLIKSHMDDINKFIDYIPETYKGLNVCSKERKEFYKEGLRLRLENILEPKLEQVLNKEKNLSLQ